MVIIWDISFCTYVYQPILAIIIVTSDVFDGVERFKIEEAVLLSDMKHENIQKRSLLTFLKKGDIFLDISMHLKPGGSLRSHGTRFRATNSLIMEEFYNKKEIIK